jgi:hypothetical protein
MKVNSKMNKLVVAGALVVVLAMLLFSYVFLFVGKIVLALVAFLIASVISLGALLGVGKRHPKDHLI